MLLHGDGTNGAQNNTFLDSSTNNFTITRNGNTTQGSFSPYGSNWSNYFDGTGDYLTTSSSQIIQTGSFTVECFVFITGSGNNQKFVSQGTSGTAGRFSVGIEGGNWWVQLGSDAVQTGTPVRNQWNYVAATFNGSTLSLYVNGSLISSVSTSTNAQNTTLTIGQDWNSYTTTGYISNVRVSNTVRTVTTTPTAPFTSDGNTRLLACQANRFLDSSANAFALTVNGNPSVQRFNPFGASTAYSTSVIGGSGYFDGSGDYLVPSSNTPMDFGTGNFTIECWVYTGDKSISGGASRTIIGNSGNSYTMQLYIDTSVGKVVFGNTGSTNLQATSTISNSAWHHIVVVRSGTGTNQTAIFVDGVREALGTNSQNYTSGTIYLGAFGTSDGFWNGYISNLRIVKGTAVYEPTVSTLTIPTSPLSAVTNTALLLNTINAAIFDNAMMNDLETVGNAQISTSVKKYGTGSLAFDGSGDYLKVSANSVGAFGTGDFTFECWFYPLTLPADVSTMYSSNNDATTSGTITINVFDDGKIKIGDLYATSSSLSTNSWSHIAVCRASGTLRIFINGTQGSSNSVSTSYTSNGGYIGARIVSGTTYAVTNGYIDDLRITKGYARYTATFTPPTSALSDTGPY